MIRRYVVGIGIVICTVSLSAIQEKLLPHWRTQGIGFFGGMILGRWLQRCDMWKEPTP